MQHIVLMPALSNVDLIEEIAAAGTRGREGRHLAPEKQYVELGSVPAQGQAAAVTAQPAHTRAHILPPSSGRSKEQRRSWCCLEQR